VVALEVHDCVVPTSDLPSEGLLSRDVGTVVHINRNVSAYEVEFATELMRDEAVGCNAVLDCLGGAAYPVG
jgi:hypothetical protein